MTEERNFEQQESKQVASNSDSTSAFQAEYSNDMSLAAGKAYCFDASNTCPPLLLLNDLEGHNHSNEKFDGPHGRFDDGDEHHGGG